MSRFKGRPFIGWCLHREQLVTITAGLERSVCEKCGHIRLRYVESTVLVYPEVAEEPDPPLARYCGVCGKKATFMIPNSVACASHAWAEAARQEELDFDIWVPIRIDQNAKAEG